MKKDFKIWMFAVESKIKHFTLALEQTFTEIELCFLKFSCMKIRKVFAIYKLIEPLFLVHFEQEVSRIFSLGIKSGFSCRTSLTIVKDFCRSGTEKGTFTLNFGISKMLTLKWDNYYTKYGLRKEAKL